MKEIEKNDDLDLFLPNGYTAPQSQDSIVNTESGQVQDIKELSPFEQMKWAAKKYNIAINDNPKKNCKRCFGRGYIGLNTDKSPVPCPCMFPKVEQTKEQREQVPLSMLPKKVQRKYFRDKRKQLKKEIRKESTLRALRQAKDEFLASLTSGTSVTSGSDAFGIATTENNGSLPSKESEETNGREVTQG